MDHDLVVRQKLTERYLLNELDPTERDEFEEHYFICTECAHDVRAASEFVEQSKTVLAENTQPTAEPVGLRYRPGGGWLAWLRPVFTAPALALLLAVVGYQNLVTYPSLRAALDQPRALPSVFVSLNTMGDSRESVTTAQRGSFLLLVRVPPGGTYMQYIADLYNSNESIEWSTPLSSNPGQEYWPIYVPGKDRIAGTYKIKISGITAAGEHKDLGNALFDLQIQKP